jgi:hypothetical protein
MQSLRRKLSVNSIFSFELRFLRIAARDKFVALPGVATALLELVSGGVDIDSATEDVS